MSTQNTSNKRSPKSSELSDRLKEFRSTLPKRLQETYEESLIATSYDAVMNYIQTHKEDYDQTQQFFVQL